VKETVQPAASVCFGGTSQLLILEKKRLGREKHFGMSSTPVSGDTVGAVCELHAE